MRSLIPPACIYTYTLRTLTHTYAHTLSVLYSILHFLCLYGQSRVVEFLFDVYAACASRQNSGKIKVRKPDWTGSNQPHSLSQACEFINRKSYYTVHPISFFQIDFYFFFSLFSSVLFCSVLVYEMNGNQVTRP